MAGRAFAGELGYCELNAPFAHAPAQCALPLLCTWHDRPCMRFSTPAGCEAATVGWMGAARLNDDQACVGMV